MIIRDLNVLRVHIRRIRREMYRLIGIGLDKLMNIIFPIIELILILVLKFTLIALLIKMVCNSIVMRFNT